MWDALDQDTAVGRDGGDFAASDGLVDGEQRVGIVADVLDFWYVLANQARGLVVGVLAEELGELAVGGEGGLDRNDDIGREVGDAGNCMSGIIVSYVAVIWLMVG